MTLPTKIESALADLRKCFEDLVETNRASSDLVESLRADVFHIQSQNTALHAEIAELELSAKVVPLVVAPAADPLADVLEDPPPAPRSSRVPPLASEVQTEPEAPAAAPAPVLAPAVTRSGRPLVVKGSGN